MAGKLKAFQVFEEAPYRIKKAELERFLTRHEK